MRTAWWITTIGIGAALCSASEALAQATVGAVAPPSNVDAVIDTMRGASVAWMGEMLKIAGLLYGSLFTMEWMVRSGFLVLKGSADVKAVFVLFFQLLLRRGIWGGIIASGSVFLPGLVRGFHEAGVRAGNAAAGAVAGGIEAGSASRPAVTPQALAEGVFEFAVARWENISIFTPDLLMAWSSMVVSTLIVVISFGLCSLFTWLVYIRAYLKLGGGPVLLGFGGSSVTEHIAKSYLQSLVSAGVSLMMIELVKSLVFPFLNSWIAYAKQDPGLGLQTSWRMALGGFVMAVCIISIQGVSQSMVSGGGGGQTAEGMTLAAIWTAVRAASTFNAASSAGGLAAGAASLSSGGTPPPSGAGGSGIPTPPSPPLLPSGGGAGASATMNAGGGVRGGQGGGSRGGGAPTAIGPFETAGSVGAKAGASDQGLAVGARATDLEGAPALGTRKEAALWDSRVGPAANQTTVPSTPPRGNA